MTVEKPDEQSLESEIVRAILLAEKAQKQGWVVLAAKEILYRLRPYLNSPMRESAGWTKGEEDLLAALERADEWLKFIPHRDKVWTDGMRGCVLNLNNDVIADALVRKHGAPITPRAGGGNGGSNGNG